MEEGLTLQHQFWLECPAYSNVQDANNHLESIQRILEEFHINRDTVSGTIINIVTHLALMRSQYFTTREQKFLTLTFVSYKAQYADLGADHNTIASQPATTHLSHNSLKHNKLY
ncbi:hypothetical protein SARC_09065 [Sphaeroforma arctica JP610]|uniref:Uncharacterized protein n=1 Tax=Sphaeroforma arctica JP610 TaxID=667725 RepID=A0A0L0FNY0_9EUKA|nr:hypothetical protein SARC_09065 [Sphaeroforma arctica JP610]KNC78507.1 hypothetical protein SARC_09065 [Sphaeroforma arctica JP610]|eukprot:XP_014152409.1 hypothetical protein SARC_09065 [Sphaeroforma arctica JP610]